MLPRQCNMCQQPRCAGATYLQVSQLIDGLVLLRAILLSDGSLVSAGCIQHLWWKKTDASCAASG